MRRLIYSPPCASWSRRPVFYAQRRLRRPGSRLRDGCLIEIYRGLDGLGVGRSGSSGDLRTSPQLLGVDSCGCCVAWFGLSGQCVVSRQERSKQSQVTYKGMHRPFPESWDAIPNTWSCINVQTCRYRRVQQSLSCSDQSTDSYESILEDNLRTESGQTIPVITSLRNTHNSPGGPM